MKPLISENDSIYVAGHNGLAGSAICRALRKFGYKNIITATRKELDLRNQIKVKKWFKENSPDIVILAAAKVGGIFANCTYPYDFIIENIQIQTNVIESAFQNKTILAIGNSIGSNIANIALVFCLSVFFIKQKDTVMILPKNMFIGMILLTLSFFLLILFDYLFLRHLF